MPSLQWEYAYKRRDGEVVFRFYLRVQKRMSNSSLARAIAQTLMRKMFQTLWESPDSSRTHKGEVADWSQAICPLCRRTTALAKRLVYQIQHLITRESWISMPSKNLYWRSLHFFSRKSGIHWGYWYKCPEKLVKCIVMRVRKVFTQ